MLVEVGVLCAVLARSPKRCEAGTSVFQIDSNSSPALVLTADWSARPDILFGGDLESALAHDLACLKDVRHVLVERADNNLLVWIALDNPTREVRERVFRKELGLIEGFPEVDFDFNVIPAKSSDPHQFTSSARLIYSREDASAN